MDNLFTKIINERAVLTEQNKKVLKTLDQFKVDLAKQISFYQDLRTKLVSPKEDLDKCEKRMLEINGQINLLAKQIKTNSQLGNRIEQHLLKSVSILLESDK